MKSFCIFLNCLRVCCIYIIKSCDYTFVISDIFKDYISVWLGNRNIFIFFFWNCQSHRHLRNSLARIGINKKFVNKNRFKLACIIRHNYCKNIFWKLFAVYCFHKFFEIILAFGNSFGELMIKRNIRHNAECRHSESFKFITFFIFNQNIVISDNHRNSFCQIIAP